MPIKILLVEDNPDHAMLAKRALKDMGEGYEVDSVSGVKEAVTSTIEKNYDLILSDYRLPGSSALELLKKIKESGRDLPFVVVTSAGSEKIAVELMREGAYDYVVKDNLYEEVLPLVVKKTLGRYAEKKKKEEAERALRESQGELKAAYTKLKEAQQLLIQAEKMEAVGTMASGVAHEVKNPLGIILQGVNFLESKIDLGKKDVAEVFNIMKDNIKRADDIIRGLVDFTRVTKLNIESHDINIIVKSSLDLVRHKLKLGNIQVVTEEAEGLPEAMVDIGRIKQVFVNVFLNAIQAMPKGGKLFIRTHAVELKRLGEGVGRRESDYFKFGEKGIIVEIEDAGVGIPEENMKRIFDPFFSTKGPRGGAGLGLSVTKSIIDMHNGLIDIQSKEGKGTKVTITLKSIAGNK